MITIGSPANLTHLSQFNFAEDLPVPLTSIDWDERRDLLGNLLRSAVIATRVTIQGIKRGDLASTHRL